MVELLFQAELLITAVCRLASEIPKAFVEPLVLIPVATCRAGMW